MKTKSLMLVWLGLLVLASCANRSGALNPVSGASSVSNERKEFFPRIVHGVCEIKIPARAHVVNGNDLSEFKSLVAFLPKNSDKCDALDVGVDYFSKDVYGGDPYFLPMLARVEKWLSGTSISELYPLGDEVATELLDSRMSALTGILLSSIQPEEKDRYDISFYLKGSKRVVLLSIDDNGGNPEWGEIVE